MQDQCRSCCLLVDLQGSPVSPLSCVPDADATARVQSVSFGLLFSSCLVGRLAV